MGKCNTLDNKWRSRLPRLADPNDGFLSIEEEGTDGSFNGKHEKTDKHLKGKCREPHGKPHSIWFEVKDNNHLYFGVFVDNRTIEGVRLDLSALRKRTDKVSGDEEWVATKT